MICLLLAAGYATRMHPLTLTAPKPLLEVRGKPILNWLLDDIDAIGAVTKHVVISNHAFFSCFRDWREAQRYSKPIVVLDDGTEDNGRRLGAVREIQFAVDALGLDDDLLIAAGDNLLDFSLAGFVAFWQARRASCVMCYEENDPERLQRTAVITVDADRRATHMEEKPCKPKGNLAVPPFYCYRREDIARLPEALADGCGADAPGSLAVWLSQRTPLYAWPMPGKRIDIGNMQGYLTARAEYTGRNSQ